MHATITKINEINKQKNKNIRKPKKQKTCLPARAV